MVWKLTGILWFLIMMAINKLRFNNIPKAYKPLWSGMDKFTFHRLESMYNPNDFNEN
jgi:hypothetical protein